MYYTATMILVIIVVIILNIECFLSMKWVEKNFGIPAIMWWREGFLKKEIIGS